MSAAQYALIKSIILPPGVFLLAFALCFFIYFLNRKWFAFSFSSTILFMYLLSTPIISRNITLKLENYDAIKIENLDEKKSSAIIVLGCNRNSKAPEFSEKDTISSCTLVRLRYSVILQKLTGYPIIISGGSVFDESISEAKLMQDVLEKEFDARVLATEGMSRNTMENAKEVTKLIKINKIQQVLLVTHAIHMSRAEYAFAQYGIYIIPAPTYFYSTMNNRPNYFDFLPSITAFHISNMALYEIIGYLWLRISNIK